MHLNAGADHEWIKRHWPHWFHRHPFRRYRPVLLIRGLAIELQPEERLQMAQTLNVGQTDALGIAFLDQNGQPMATNPAVDAPPSWSNTETATDSIVPSADGLTATLTAQAAGTDTVNLSLNVEGKTFTAALDVTVEPAPQVLTSVEITAAPPA